jgi:hypothetical protein
MCGDAAWCIGLIALLCEKLGITHYWARTNVGGLERCTLRDSMERFATRVIPQWR